MNCKICGHSSRLVFEMPASKATGDPGSLFGGGPQAQFYECRSCRFLFSDVLDNKPQFYEHEFLCSYDKEPGSDIQYMRLLAMAASILKKPLYECRVLDFGSGAGEFVQLARQYADFEVWGFDLARPSCRRPHIIDDLSGQRFDIVVAREVVEHFTDPLAGFRQMRAALKDRGAIAFQTNLYRPGIDGRDWDYIGPRNGHVSLYSEQSLRFLQKKLGVEAVAQWKNRPTVAAWRIARDPRQEGEPAVMALPLEQFRYSDPSVLVGGVVELSDHIPKPGTAVLYGPYLALDKGAYILRIAGIMRGEFRATVANHRGPIHKAIGANWLPEIGFEMAENTWAWEFVIRTTARSEYLKIENIALLPVRQAPRARFRMGGVASPAGLKAAIVDRWRSFAQPPTGRRRG
jgi:2-polyprenyl-3-methyl-5-hydroxy-6-metoxy-1,4-benzoquinol methylase